MSPIEDAIDRAVNRVVVKLEPRLVQLEEAVREIADRLPAPLVTYEVAAKRLNLSVSTVRRRVKDGTLPSKRVGRAVRIDLAAALRSSGEDHHHQDDDAAPDSPAAMINRAAGLSR